jgi:TonB family protein
VQPVAEWLARTAPQRFVAMVPELIKITGAAPIVGEVAAMGLRQTPAAADAISSALSISGSSSAWSALLDALHADLTPDVLRKGLTAQSASIREATVWFLVLNRSRETTDNLTALVSESKQINPSEATDWTRFGYDLLGRRTGEKATDHSAVIARAATDHKVELRRLAQHSELTDEERTALKSALRETQTISTNTPTSPSPTPVEGETKRLPLPTRMFEPIAPGFFTSLLSAVRCSPSGGSTFGAARLSYRLDGHVKAVGLDSTTLSDSCATFLRLLARLAVAQPNARIVDTESQWLFIAMDKASIDWIDADPITTATGGDVHRIGGGVLTPPHKIRDVRPLYPPSMQRAGIQGTVIIEATISKLGCVTAGQVLRSVELPLDLAAMKAVSGWRFEPTVLDGNPVPVIMTVTVTFRLQ